MNKLKNETGLHVGRYAIVSAMGKWIEGKWIKPVGYEVWNGTNNYRLTDQLFPTGHAARQWAEDNGFTMRATNACPIPE